MPTRMSLWRLSGGASRRGALMLVTAACAGACLVSACSSNVSASSGATQGAQQAAKGGKINIGFIGFGDAVTFTQAVYQQMQAQAAKSGVSVTLIDGGLSPTVQSTAMQDAIESGKYSALVVQPNDAVSLATQVRAAAKAGISVIALDYTFGPLNEQGELSQLMPQVKSTIGLGRNLVTDTFVKNVEASCAARVGPDKPCKVGLMAGDRADPFSNETASSIQAGLAKTGYITAGFTPDGQLTEAGGYNAAITYLENNKNVDVMWSESDLQTIGIARALVKDGLTPGKNVYLNSYSGSTQAIAAIRAGQWFSSLPIYPQEGAQALLDAIALAHGKSVPATTNEYSLPGTLPDLTAQTLKADPSFQSNWSATNG